MRCNEFTGDGSEDGFVVGGGGSVLRTVLVVKSEKWSLTVTVRPLAFLRRRRCPTWPPRPLARHRPRRPCGHPWRRCSLLTDLLADWYVAHIEPPRAETTPMPWLPSTRER
jgi:hypothetical protein